MPKRVDANHRFIVDGLEKVGARVQSMADLGKGCADVLVAFRNRWYVAEIKDGSKPPSKRKLTEAEEEWHKRFSPKAPVHIWTSLEEALRAIGATE